MYANDAVTDAAGYYGGLSIGGNSNTTVKWWSGAVMNLYMNSTEFVSGGITDANPKLLIKLADDNGINITGTALGMILQRGLPVRIMMKK